MNKVRTVNSTKDAAYYRAEISASMAEIDRLREIMKQDDIEIEQSQAQTKKLLAEIKAMRVADRSTAA